MVPLTHSLLNYRLTKLCIGCLSLKVLYQWSAFSIPSGFFLTSRQRQGGSPQKRKRSLWNGSGGTTVALAPRVLGFKGVWIDLKQVVRDKKMWLFGILQLAHIGACGFTNFFPSLMKSIGSTCFQSVLFTSPPYVLATFVCSTVAYISGRYNARIRHITVYFGAALIGFVNFGNHTKSSWPLCEHHFGSIRAYATNSIMLGWVAGTLGQTTEKKAMALGMMNIFDNSSYLYTPFWYSYENSPFCPKAMAANAVFAATTIACCWWMRLWLKSDNK